MQQKPNSFSRLVKRLLSIFVLAFAFSLSIASTGVTREYRFEQKETALTPIDTLTFRVGSFAHSGGALEQWGNDLIVATPTGHIILARDAANKSTQSIQLELLSEKVPMALPQLWQTAFAAHSDFNSRWFRVADILLTDNEGTKTELYASHHVASEDCIAVVVSRITLERAQDGEIRVSGPWERVFEAKPCVLPKEKSNVFAGHQIGGKMIMHPTGELWLALGDHGFDGVGSNLRAPLDDSVDFGKLISIDTKTKAKRTVARGLRAPQGLLMTADGLIWEAEHGPRGGDELNLIVEGENYGWPLVTLGLGYNGPWPLNEAQGRHEGFKGPRFAFVPSVALSALAEVSGAEFDVWQGDLVLATLRQKTLYRLRREGDRIVYAEPILEDLARFRDVVSLRDGRLALLTDRADIVLLSGTGRDPASVQVTGLRDVVLQLESQRDALGLPNRWSGEALFARHCASCHRLDGTPDVGPHLNGLLNRPVGTADFAYSASLSQAQQTWTPELVYEYLRDPDSVFPDSVMTRVDLSPAEIQEIVRWLESDVSN